MLEIRDRFGFKIFESEYYEEIVNFAKRYKVENNIKVIEVLKRSGLHHSYI